MNHEKKFNSHSLFDIKHDALNLILFISAVTAIFAATIHTFNRRPLSNIMLPLMIGLILFILYYLSTAKNYHSFVKYAFFVILNVLYLPIAWLTSPGSNSAMPLYTFLIIVTSALLADSKKDYLFPIFCFLEAILMYFIEYQTPEKFATYTDLKYRVLDIGVNFSLCAIIALILIFYINNHFIDKSTQLYRLSVTDHLTGLYNRRFLIKNLETEYNKASRTNMPFAILLIDIDNFKLVNDNFGHHDGDIMLSNLGDILRNHSRNYDIAGRFGGDEFLVILPHTTVDAAQSYASRIRNAFSHVAMPYIEYDVQISIGIASSENKTLDEILKIADDSLYKTKRKTYSNKI